MLIRLRNDALRCLSSSGTDRALEMLVTGKGLPEDLKLRIEDLRLFRDAVRVRVGLDGYPEVHGQTLPPETIAQMTEIFQKYGLTYTEDPLIEQLRQDIDDICD